MKKPQSQKPVNIKNKYNYIDSIEELDNYPYIIINGKKVIVIDIIK
ncbi:MAG: hypothetical protein N3E37_01905 [Candidatus Micrarchaeota archaeon]|nr:hypothetical protein [Candidatus Micrarchaeota archaeon]